MHRKILSLTFIFATLTSTPLFSDEAKINIGERLFSDPRFSRSFLENSNNDVNNLNAKGTSCLTCHQVDAKFDPTSGIGMRGYADFTARSPVPFRLQDEKKETLRNTQGLVGIGSPFLKERFAHWDGEFPDHSHTVLGNMTGRNMGWLPHEKELALKNMVTVLREDNGDSSLAKEFGGSYQRVFLGVDPSIPDSLRLSPEDTLDLQTATDEMIRQKVIELITAFMDDLDFEKVEVEKEGLKHHEIYDSPYDHFLYKNKLPVFPKKGQNLATYSLDLRKKIAEIKNPKFIEKRFFPTHGRAFEFGPREWEGMKVFYNIANEDGTQRRGACFSCHLPPAFSDQKFHNVGTMQREYDRIHGDGSFQKVEIPSLKKRNQIFYMKRAKEEDPNAFDLGVWNFFARADKPELTQYIRKNLCPSLSRPCENSTLLPLLEASFKTPTLRNLNHSAPYFHNGSSPHLMHLLHEYKRASELKRKKQLRGGANELIGMFLFHKEIHSLKAFLDSLNGSYD